MSIAALPGLVAPSLARMLSSRNYSLAGEVSKFLYHIYSLTHVSGYHSPVWQGLPSILAFACASRCFSLAQSSFFPVLGPTSVSEFCGLAWLGLLPLSALIQTNRCCIPTMASLQVPIESVPRSISLMFRWMQQLNLIWPIPCPNIRGQVPQPSPAMHAPFNVCW